MHKIGILGSGEWSHKIVKSLEPQYFAEQYSSRAVKDGSQSLDESIQAIWITSKNSEQIELAELLIQSRFPGKIILEKPYFTNPKELIQLRELINSNKDKIHLSQVWIKSRIWKVFLDIILTRTGTFQVTALRVGNKRRSEFSPPFDWAPHDLYLALDLSRSLRQEIKVIDSHWESDNDVIEGSLTIGANCKLVLKAGFSSERINSWKVTFENGDNLELDFFRRTIKVNEIFVFQESEAKIHDVPILNFVNWVLTQADDLEQEKLLDLNFRFILEAAQA